MLLLLERLARETFRSDLPPWVDLSYAIAGVDVIVLAASSVAGSGKPATTSMKEASKYFVYLAMVNAAAAAAFALPVLDPAYEFPILITRWPGIYMVLAYAFFVIVGVLGSVGWASALGILEDSVTVGPLRRTPLILQLTLTEAGVYGLAVFMFLGGYVGASLDYGGGGAGIVGISMEFAVIPSALSIFSIILGTLLGLGNVVLAPRPAQHRDDG